MSEAIFRPSREIKAFCDHCDDLIEAYLKGLTSAKLSSRFEAEVEYYSLLKLMIRHLEAVTVLAKTDLVLLPSANAISRTLFEASARARWLFLPTDPFEREVRWLLFFRTGKSQARKLSKSQHLRPRGAEIYESLFQTYDSFDASLYNLLTERGYSIPKQLPNLWDTLKELENPELYNFYVILSAHTHSSFESLGYYRKNLGGAKNLGEFVTAEDWKLSLEVAYKSFFQAAEVFLRNVDADIEMFLRFSKVDQIEDALSAIKNE